MSKHLLEHLRTDIQSPRTRGASFMLERLDEVVRLRKQAWLNRDIARRQDLVIEWQKNIIREQRELLRQAEPCPACVAKGKP